MSDAADPAAIAAAAPEPDLPAEGATPDERPADRSASGDATAEVAPVHAVGVGPGDPEHLTPRAERAIRAADVVVGFGTVVDLIRDRTDADLLACGYDDEGETLDRFADRVAAGARGTAVLMGDPNHSGYQFVGKVQAAVDAPVRVVPGISSLQVAASRARTPMEETAFVTLHKRGPIEDDLARLRAAVGDRHLLVLPRPYDWMPGDVAAHLLAAGADSDLDALVLERLTREDERITRTTLADLAVDAGGSGPGATPYSDLSVLAVRR